MSTHVHLTFNTHSVQVKRSNKRRSLAVSIQAGKIVVYAPQLCPDKHIEQLLEQKQKWVERHLNLYKKQHAQAKIQHQDQQYLFKGERHTLKTHIGPSSVYHEPPYIHIMAPTHTLSNTHKNMLKAWYRAHTLNWAQQACKIWGAQMRLHPKTVSVRSYRARWGCCNTTQRKITLHALLSMAPEYVFNSVIIHELAHLQHANHSKDFWTLVHTYDLHHTQAKQWLKLHRYCLNII